MNVSANHITEKPECHPPPPSKQIKKIEKNYLQTKEKTDKLDYIKI